MSVNLLILRGDGENITRKSIRQLSLVGVRLSVMRNHF